jgi:hypothetical protein
MIPGVQKVTFKRTNVVRVYPEAALELLICNEVISIRFSQVESLSLKRFVERADARYTYFIVSCKKNKWIIVLSVRFRHKRTSLQKPQTTHLGLYMFFKEFISFDCVLK